MAADWQLIAGAPLDRPVKLYCPATSPSTNGVLLGQWLDRLSIWQLLPYGTTQPIAIVPTHWAELDAPPG